MGVDIGGVQLVSKEEAEVAAGAAVERFARLLDEECGFMQTRHDGALGKAEWTAALRRAAWRFSNGEDAS